MQLYETHLPVADTEASRKFYMDVLGLEFGFRDQGRDIDVGVAATSPHLI